jgi:hypothetical protein
LILSLFWPSTPLFVVPNILLCYMCCSSFNPQCLNTGLCCLCFKDELQELNPAASPYAKVTPTGVDPKLAAQRARIDWDAAAEIQPGAEQKELTDMVPPAVGFSLLYVVSFIPIIIGVTVVLILFFNSLQ